MTNTPDSVRDVFSRAFHELTLSVAAKPDLRAFAGWPYAPLAHLDAEPVPAIEIIQNWSEGYSNETASLHHALQAIAPYARWQQTYTEQEVGRDFLNRYGYIEFVGPTGHFASDQVRAYFAYWGDNLYYPWHLHQAEELYYIISGQALFEADGQPAQVLKPGDIRVHASNQPHAMTTTDSPILALVLWRGDGIDGLPRMGRR
jgi:mannose-6-phosphate isomerase-like protein (cupin superfamily)